MKSIYHNASSRGHAAHGWLDTYHTFSFANYYDPKRIHFGALRVLNDDTIAGGKGFDMHPHDNMEIITIPLKGSIEHKDSMNNSSVISQGEIQVMSAGTGILHSEYNHEREKDLQLLQIWIFTNKKNVEPRYQQISIKNIEKENQLFQILSPEPKNDGVWIYQDAWFHLGYLEKNWQGTYQLKGKNHGVYAFVIDGNISIENQTLNKRDGLGIWDTQALQIKSESKSTLLLMEVPMTF